MGSKSAPREWRPHRRVAVPLWFVRVLGVAFLVQLAVYAIRPMASYRALALGASSTQLGAVAAAFAVLSFVFAVPVGRWVDRHGEGRFVALGALLTAGVAFALASTDSLLLLGLTQALLGLGHLFMTVAIQTLIANSDEPTHRDARFGVFTVMVSFGQLAGPAVAGVLAGQGVSAVVSSAASAAEAAGAVRVFVVAGGAATLACLLAATLWRVSTYARGRGLGDPASEATASDAAEAPAPPPPGDVGGARPSAAKRPSVAKVLRLPSMLQAMFASVAVLTSSDILVVYLPAYGQVAGLSVATVGFLLATRSAASIVARMLMGVLVAWLGRGPLLVACTAVPAAALAVMPLLGRSLVLFPLIALAGLGLGLGQPLSLAWVAAKAPPGVRGTALAVRLSGNRLGQVVVPAAIGGLVGLTGPGVIFWALTFMLAASSAASSRTTFDR